MGKKRTNVVKSRHPARVLPSRLDPAEERVLLCSSCVICEYYSGGWHVVMSSMPPPRYFVQPLAIGALVQAEYGW
eukprot:scaffold117759_cov28-Tisochrysis_lutea.AAC.1